MHPHSCAVVANLEMQVVDGAIRSQRIVAQPEVWVVAVLTKLQCKPHGGLVHKLSQPVHDTRYQQYVAVFYWADIDEHQVWAVIGWGSRDELEAAVTCEA